MGTLFSTPTFSSKAKINYKGNDFERSFQRYLKTQLPKATLDKSFMFPVYKTNKGDYFAMTKDEIDEIGISPNIAEDKILFFGKMVYMIPFQSGVTLIDVYQNRNEFTFK